MNVEQRKASEVLLELEAKVNAILDIIRTQDLNNKIISNKLNSTIQLLEKLNSAPPAPPKIEAINTLPTSTHTPAPTSFSEREIPISAENKISVEEAPKGFRRNSRPETFAGDDSFLPENNKYPVQVPKMSNQPPPGRAVEEVSVPKKTVKNSKNLSENTTESVVLNSENLNAVPVSQRVVNAHGKSLFLADVEVIDLKSMQSVSKTRTNGTGKWSASLPVGNYRVFIRKLDSATKEKLEVKQDIVVDGQQSPLELSVIIIKSQ